MAPLAHAAFSPDLELFAVCAADGKLKIFDTKLNKVLHDFVPDGHLNGRIRSLCWITAPSQLCLQVEQKTPKKRKVIVEDCPDKRVLLLGQQDGSILLYSSNLAETVGALSSGVACSVDAIAWSSGNDVFAGMSNGRIVRWTLPNTKCIRSWSPRDGASVSVLAVHPKEPWLISASRMIIVWDIATEKRLQTFVGHESPIRQLLFAPSGDHLVSIGNNDRNINVWPLHKLKADSKKSSSSSPVAMFVLQDYPAQIDVAISKDGAVNLSAVTEGGSLSIFSETINGKVLEPSKPRLTVQVAQTDSPANSAVEQIPILAARFKPDDVTKMMISYGESFYLRFDNLDVNSKQSLLILQRKHPRKVTQKSENDSRIKGDISKAQYITATGTKRPSSSQPVYLPIEDRLKNLSVDKFEELETHVPSGPATDSLSKLLQQGLASMDKKLQKEILLKRDPKVISSTVAELPVQCVFPLVQELVVLVHWRGWRGEAATKWLNELLMQHGSIILGSPQLMALIQPIIGLVEVRLVAQHSLSKLKGRLQLLLAQMTLRGKLKKMSPQQNNATNFDIDDDSESSSDEDNLSLADSNSEGEESEEMDEDANSDAQDEDDADDGENEEVEDDEEEAEEVAEKPQVNGWRSRRKSKGDTEDMKC